MKSFILCVFNNIPISCIAYCSFIVSVTNWPTVLKTQQIKHIYYFYVNFTIDFMKTMVPISTLKLSYHAKEVIFFYEWNGWHIIMILLDRGSKPTFFAKSPHTFHSDSMQKLSTSCLRQSASEDSTNNSVLEDNAASYMHFIHTNYAYGSLHDVLDREPYNFGILKWVFYLYKLI
jgi:hypothetical protein